MNPVSKIVVKGVDIWIVDYRGFKEDEMIALATELRSLIELERKPIALLVKVADSDDITSNYMKHVAKEICLGGALVGKIAIVGLSTLRQWMLRGYNTYCKLNLHSFASEKEAMTYLSNVG